MNMMQMNEGESGEGSESSQMSPPSETAGKTALLPLSLLPSGAKPGDTVTLKVVSLNGEEAIVGLAGKSQEPEPMSADEEIDSMAKENE